MQVRVCANRAEMSAALAPIWHYFGQLPPTEDAIKHFLRVLEPQRMHAAFDGDAAVAGSGSFPFDLTVPGGQVKAAGVTVVGVLPTHRRRGLLRAMKRSMIDAAHARGEAVAVLWATEDTIYGQFGYGMASMAAEIDVPREHTRAFAQIDVPGAARLVPLDEAEPLIAPVYERVARETPGMFARTSAWWQDRLLVDHPWQRRGGGALRCAVWETGGKPAAYAFYRVNPDVRARLVERPCLRGRGNGGFAAGDPRDLALSVRDRLLARVKAIFLPLDHPLLLSLADPRRLNFLVREGLWVRLIDVGAALSARGYATDDAIVIDVTDEFCPWNAGRWRVARGKVEKTTAEPDLACDIARSAASISAVSLSRNWRVRCG